MRPKMTNKEMNELEKPQCPECGNWNTRALRKRRVDFYGIPVVYRCSCGWEKEILPKE